MRIELCTNRTKEDPLLNPMPTFKTHSLKKRKNLFSFSHFMIIP